MSDPVLLELRKIVLDQSAMIEELLSRVKTIESRLQAKVTPAEISFLPTVPTPISTVPGSSAAALAGTSAVTDYARAAGRVARSVRTKGSPALPAVPPPAAITATPAPGTSVSEVNSIATRLKSRKLKSHLPKVLEEPEIQPLCDNGHAAAPPHNSTAFNRRRSTTRPICKGTGTQDDALIIVRRNLHLHAFMFHHDTTEDQIRNYLNKQNSAIEFTVEKLATRHDRYASFKIGIPEHEFSYFLNPNVWPANVAFNEWTFRRPRFHSKPSADDDKKIGN